MTAVPRTLGEIATAVGGDLRGDPARVLRRVRGIEEAGPEDLAVVLDRRRAAAAVSLAAGALIVPDALPAESLAGRDVVFVRNARQAMIEVLRLFHPDRPHPPGVHASACVSPEARIHPEAWVGPGAVLEARADVGARSEIHAHAYLGEGVAIGEDTVIHPNVTLYAGTRVGSRVRIHAGAVLGSDGFGFPRGEDGALRKVPQVGIVEVDDDVEIGANCTIDRATLEATRVGRGTKIDNLVQIGHNARIGTDCCIMGQVGISGSVRVGSFATLCGQVGIADGVELEERVVVGAQSGVPHDLTEGVWLGTPARLATEMRRIFPAMAKLPQLRLELQALAARLEEIEKGRGRDE
jgi:UDP-3-O-[3-hydroxymyristoyl] glucosamine N-acyltransferase